MRNLFLIFVLLFSVGCATWQDTARVTVNTGGIVLAETDATFAPAYTEASVTALEESETLAEYKERMKPWDDTVLALKTAADSLRAIEDILDAGIAGAEGRFLQLAGELLSGMQHILELLVGLGVEVPVGLTSFIEDLNRLTGFIVGPEEEQ
jgi:hypothetical protein